MPDIKTVGIFSKPRTAAAESVVPRLLEWLTLRNIVCRLDSETASYAGLPDGLTREQVPEGCQLVIVLGGDGTLLSAARAIGNREIPLFAVNLGSLGFMAAITVDDLFPELERSLAGQHKVSRRRMLSVEIQRGDSVKARYEALNDVVVTKSSIARMIEVDVFVNTHHMCSYFADGLILATPTGSTAYSLAANGPIVFPTVEAVCITPICPHTLTNRPVLVPSDVVITVVNRAEDASAFLTVDGQVGEPLHEGDRIECRTAEHFVYLVRSPHKSFFDVLRQKLKWGEG
jgi:NAD+ kinase